MSDMYMKMIAVAFPWVFLFFAFGQFTNICQGPRYFKRHNSNCMSCIDGYDIESNCTTCLGNYDPATGCATCIINYDFISNCSTCIGNYDLDSKCSICARNYDLMSNCTSCTRNRIGRHCNLCDFGLTGSDCNECAQGVEWEGVYPNYDDENKRHFTFTFNFQGPDCKHFTG